MTKHQKQKQARHNAEKDAVRRRLTVAEMEQRFSDMRRQEAEANARIQEKVESFNDDMYNYMATHNMYTVPRLCAGFFYAALQAAKKRLIRSQVELFMDELSEEMQKIVNEAGDAEAEGIDPQNVDRAFNEIARKLEAEGYAVPEWAQLDDFDHVKDLVKNGGK